MNKHQSKKIPTCMDKLRECLCFVFCCKKKVKLIYLDLNAPELKENLALHNAIFDAPELDPSQFNGSTSTMSIMSIMTSATINDTYSKKNDLKESFLNVKTAKINKPYIGDLNIDNLKQLHERQEYTVKGDENKLLPTPMQHDIAQESTAPQSISQKILSQLKEKKQEQEQEQPHCMGLKIKEPQLLLANEAFNKKDTQPNNEPGQ